MSAADVATTDNKALLRRGRSDGIRTHDLLVPNQARYQLRYTPTFCVGFYRRYLLYNFIYKKARLYTPFFIKFYAFA